MKSEMKHRVNRNLILMLILSLVLSFTLGGCSKSPSEAGNTADGADTKVDAKTYDALMAEENDILNANNDLWEKVFASMSKNVTEDTLSDNYGDVLMNAVEDVKNQLSTEEYEKLKADADAIREIEKQIAALPPESSSAAGSSASSAAGDAFPAFEGKYLEGNGVDSSLFFKNAFTVLNFWFNECKPCVEELGDLDTLNQKVQEQGGEVIGINAGALDGDASNIETAKQILESKGASYRNIYFDSDSEAGKFTLAVQAFPTTYVVDSNGKIVGTPILGAITGSDNQQKLQNLIDEAIK